MSGIVGSKLNIRGSGLVASYGTDGQHMLSAGAGVSNVFETAAGGGKILQVLQVYKQDHFTTSSGSYVDVTDMTLDITPAATSSKILVMTSMNAIAQNWFSLNLVRDSTNIMVGDAASGTQTNQTISGINHVYGQTLYSVMYLDSPSTTSATTYKVQGMCDHPPHALYFGRSSTNYDNRATGSCASTLTLMEIGA